MLLRRLLAPLMVLVSLAACDSTTFSLDGPLAIRAGDGEVWLHNRTNAPVYAYVIDREHATLVEWVPCSDPTKCDGIAPDGQRRIAYDDIPGYVRGADEAIIFWWHLVPAPGGSYQPDSVRSEVIRL